MAAPKKRRPPQRARMAAKARPRDARGRFLGKRAIAALAGWKQRRQATPAKRPSAAAVRRAFVHGQKAREATERRLTPTERARRKREAAAVERQAASRRRAEAARKGWQTRRERQARQTPKSPRRKKAPRAPQPAALRSRPRVTPEDFRSELEPETAAPSSTRSRTSKRSKKSTKASTTKSKPRRAPILTVEPRGKSSGDSLKVQIAVKARLPKGMKPTNNLLYEAIAYRIEHGADHPNFDTRILRWQNPGRKRGELRQWREGNQADAWTTLGPAIAAAVSL